MKDWAKWFYKSKQWQNIRANVMAADHHLCQDCLAKGLIVPAEEVHHIIPLTPQNIMDPSITLNTENLISLCRECHKARHSDGAGKRWTVDEFGRVKII